MSHHELLFAQVPQTNSNNNIHNRLLCHYSSHNMRERISRWKRLKTRLLATLLVQIPFRDASSVHAFMHKPVRTHFPLLATTPEVEDLATTRSQSTTQKIADLLISIAPPCSNKDEALEVYLSLSGYRIDEPDAFHSVSLCDTSKGIYHSVPVEAFLYPTTHLTEIDGSAILHSDTTLRDRLNDPNYAMTDSECRNMILRVAGRITPNNFADESIDRALRAGDTAKYFRKRRMSITNDLIVATEEVAVEAIGEVLVQMQLQFDKALESEEELPYDEQTKSEETQLAADPVNATSAQLMSARALIKTPTVSLFVPQKIFHGGIDKAQSILSKLLEEESSSVPLAWESTNSRPSEYAVILEAAEKANRPVKFIAWGSTWMPRVSRKDLFKRNIQRFRRTGRYIPAVRMIGLYASFDVKTYCDLACLILFFLFQRELLVVR